jgi:hypothetical protein
MMTHHTAMSKEEKYPSDKAERFQVRMYAGMRARIAASAKANGRSMNEEILARLDTSYNFDMFSVLIGALEAVQDAGETDRFLTALRALHFRPNGRKRR